MVFFTFPEDARWNAERDPAEGTSCVFCPPTRARGPCRGAGHTANGCAHGVKPRLGLMPPRRLLPRTERRPTGTLPTP
jgi:hypothetical protein